MWPFSNPAKRFFTEAEGKQIVEAIRQAELHTSGEIRIHLENRTRQPVLKRAATLFEKLKMHETEQRNGVLVYFAVSDHRFGVLADEGINRVVPEGFWDEIVANMKARFGEKDFVGGLTQGILAIGQQLQEYFPRQDDDENELPDDISYG